jgi:hypothetical protein
LTYTSLSCVKKNNFLNLLQPLQVKTFQIDPSVAMEMCQLQTITRWDVVVPKPHTFHDSHVLIYSLNTISLPLHKMIFFRLESQNSSHIVPQ